MDMIFEAPPDGEAIRFEKNGIIVPPNPIIPYIRGDGVGIDVTPVMLRVINAAVEKAYNREKSIKWVKVLAGEEAAEVSGLTPEEGASLPDSKRQKILLPKATLETIRKFKVAIKGPLTTPVGGGFRSLNVSLRQLLDLYACVRPVKWYPGVPAPLKNPEKLDVVIFRENTEDVYAGIEWREGTEEANRLRRFLSETMGKTIPEDSGIGVKPVSATATKRLVRAAINYALKNQRKSVTLVHKGNVMKYTEGAFMEWGYEAAKEEFREAIVTESEYGLLYFKGKYPNLGYPELISKLRENGYYGYSIHSLKQLIDSLYATHGGRRLHGKLLIKDRIADQMFQQLLLRPEEYDVIATLNLNGDYLSDACSAEVGGLGIAPGTNINYETGTALFEATHGSAPRHAGLDKVNPSSLILSAVMMLRYIGWEKTAEIAEGALMKAFENKTVTYDLHRQMDDATLLSTSQFGEEVIKNMSL